MGKFARGEVIVVLFPFSDLSNKKARPALVLSDCGMNDYLVCQITTVENKDQYAIRLSEESFIEGTLSRDSNIRPNKVFTLHESLIHKAVGRINETKYGEVVSTIVKLITA